MKHMNFVQTAEFDWEKLFKNHLLRSHKGGEAETL